MKQESRNRERYGYLRVLGFVETIEELRRDVVKLQQRVRVLEDIRDGLHNQMDEMYDEEGVKKARQQAIAEFVERISEDFICLSRQHDAKEEVIRLWNVVKQAQKEMKSAGHNQYNKSGLPKAEREKKREEDAQENF